MYTMNTSFYELPLRRGRSHDAGVSQLSWTENFLGVIEPRGQQIILEFQLFDNIHVFEPPKYRNIVVNDRKTSLATADAMYKLFAI